MAAKRCIFLAGAPDGDALRWDEPALLSSFDARIERFIGGLHSTVQPTKASTPVPKWRSIAFEESDVQVLWPSREHQRRREAKARDAVDSDFLEHSIALLEHLDASQIITSAPADDIGPEGDNETTFLSFNTTTSLTDTSLGDDSNATCSTIEQSVLLPNIKLAGEITDLKRIPQAEHIQRMQPQTITVNLLVGIIAISPARSVQLRRRKLEREIIEITVGDDTRAGFSISFWLVPEKEGEAPPDDLRQSLRALRSGQVILLQSVALSCFRGSVYGQSLSKRFARNSTTLVVLGDSVGEHWPKTVVSKLPRVRNWASDFVGNVRHSTHQNPSQRGQVQERLILPPDTQD